MFTFYLVCFLLGATLMLCQFVLSLLGLGDHNDADAAHDFHDVHGHDHHGHAHDHHSSWFVGVLTFRTIVAALTFFGIVGLATYDRMEVPLSLALALAAGAAAMLTVAWMMRALHRLKAEGTARIERAVGQNGTVYLSIPGQKAGAGKVTLNLQNRTVELQAVTPHQPLPTGSRIVVTAVLSPDTVEVTSATDLGSTTHE